MLFARFPTRLVCPAARTIARSLLQGAQVDTGKQRPFIFCSGRGNIDVGDCLVAAYSVAYFR